MGSRKFKTGLIWIILSKTIHELAPVATSCRRSVAETPPELTRIDCVQHSVEQFRAFPDPLVHQGNSQADLIVFKRHE